MKKEEIRALAIAISNTMGKVEAIFRTLARNEAVGQAAFTNAWDDIASNQEELRALIAATDD